MICSFKDSIFYGPPVLGMRVLVWSRNAKTSSLPAGISAADSLEELIRESDFLSLHCPLNDATRGLIDAEKLALMKSTAYLVNISRGGLVVEEDLVAALESGGIAGAGLDVQAAESPWRTDSKLFRMENVILTPHIGWKRVETRQRLLDMTAESVQAFLGGAPINVVE